MNATIPHTLIAPTNWMAYRRPLASLICSVLFASMCVASTLYIELGAVGTFVIRPPQILPLLVSLCTLVLLGHTARNKGAYVVVPVLFGLYYGTRNLVAGPENLPETFRVIVVLTIYLGALLLLDRIRDLGFVIIVGLGVGCILSTAVSALDISPFGVMTVMKSGRWTGLMPGPNRYANLCMISTLGTLGAMSGAVTMPRKLLVFGMFCVSVSGLIMSGSRGALVTTSIGLMAYSMLSNLAAGRSAISLRAILTCCVLLVVGGGLFFQFIEYVPERLAAVVLDSEQAIDSAENDSRGELFQIAWDTFLEQPVFGGGSEVGHFDVVLLDGTTIELSSHNTYLELLSTMGIVGFVLFFTLPALVSLNLFRIVCSARRYSPAVSRSAVQMLTIFAAMTAHFFAITLSDSVHVWLLLTACVAVCAQAQESLPQPDVAAANSSPTKTRGGV